MASHYILQAWQFPEAMVLCTVTNSWFVKLKESFIGISVHVKLSKISYFLWIIFLIICPVFCILDFCGSSGNIINLLLLHWNWITLIVFPLGFRKANGIRYAVLPKHFWTKKENCTHCQGWGESFCFSFCPPSLPPSLPLAFSLHLI